MVATEEESMLDCRTVHIILREMLDQEGAALELEVLVERVVEQ